MPELPEVETIRRELTPRLAGNRFATARAIRPEVVRGGSDKAALLAGRRVSEIARKGKQLAVIAEDGACFSVHLGMSGRLEFGDSPRNRPAHTHVVWTIEDGGELRFVDPRRFGGVWTHTSRDDLQRTRWDALGPDAASVTAARLWSVCRGKRAIKAVLLDQRALAGVGNIYADEALHASGIDPQRLAEQIAADEARALAGNIRRVLKRAVEARGSTLRDYRRPNGENGGYALSHAVYGRGGQECLTCGTTLESLQVGGRTTVRCLTCQR